MISVEMAKIEISTGLSAICAWCEHWHDAKRRGEVATCGKRCGGPSIGMAFPLYKGPMSSRLGEICFICGEKADAGIQWRGGFIGVCNRLGPGGKTHFDIFKELVAVPGRPMVAREIVVPVIGEKA